MARREGDFDEQGAVARSGGTGGSGTPASGDAARSDSTQREEDVRQRAYDLYLARGASDGGDVDDWLAAEREMRERPSKEPERSGQERSGRERSEPERSEPEHMESGRAGAGTRDTGAGGERGAADQMPPQRSTGATEPARGGRARRNRPGGERAD